MAVRHLANQNQINWKPTRSLWKLYWQKHCQLGLKGTKFKTLYSVTQLCLALCDPVDRSVPGTLSFTTSWRLPKLMSTGQWCHPTISPSVILSCLQSFPASGSFPVSVLFASGGQSNGAAASVLPVNIQGWLPLGLTGLIAFLSKGLSRVFSNTTVQKHQFFSTQSSLWSNSHIHTWLLTNP